MSLKIRELIKAIRSCKTAEEERSVINKEISEILTMNKNIKDQSDLIKTRNLAKSIFIHMLGYHTAFVQMYVVNLLSSNKYHEKRMAYLSLSVLLDESSEVLLLTTQTIKKDLENNNNELVVGLALNAVGDSCSPDMMRTLAPEVIKLMNCVIDPYIKKKAALAAAKIVRKCPDLLDVFVETLNNYLDEKNHGVLICGITLAIEIFKQDLSHVSKFRNFHQWIMRQLKGLISTSYSPEYDVNGVSDPFLQIKILELLKYYGKDNEKASEDMVDILTSVSSNTENNKNTGNAVLYELVKTILGIKANTSLINLSSSILGKLLATKDNNYRYIALNTLKNVAKYDLASVQKHKTVILECMKEEDISIQRRALDLVYLIINSHNIKQIINECINYLLVAENEIKYELTTKITQSLEKYSPSIKWQIDSMVKMLSLAGNFASDESVASLVNLIVKTNELHVYSVHRLHSTVKTNLAQEALVKAALYIYGEFGDKLLSFPIVDDNDQETIISEKELFDTLNEIILKKYNNTNVKEYLMNCLLKLTMRIPSSLGKITDLLENQRFSANPEIQQRSNEYLKFVNDIHSNELKNKVVMNVPPASRSNKEDFNLTKQVTVEELDVDYNDIKVKESGFQIPKTGSNRNPSTSVNSNTNLLLDINDIFAQNSNSQVQANIVSNNNLGNSIFDTLNLIGNNDQQSLGDNVNIFSQTKQNNYREVFRNSDLIVEMNAEENLPNIFLKFIVSSNKILEGVKMLFAVPKYIERVLNSPSGNYLDSNTKIQQDIQLIHNQVEKQKILRVRIVYLLNGNEVVENFQIDSF